MDEQDKVLEGVAAALGAVAGGAVAATLSPILSPAGGGACGGAVTVGVREGIKRCGPYALDVAGAFYDVATGRDREPGPPPPRCPPCMQCGGHRRPDEVAQYIAAGRSLA
jgi:hypothetical protein